MASERSSTSSDIPARSRRAAWPSYRNSVNLREDAEAFAARELGLAGPWDDPDGDGNYCLVG